jgi:hypothetical protein
MTIARKRYRKPTTLDGNQMRFDIERLQGVFQIAMQTFCNYKDTLALMRLGSKNREWQWENLWERPFFLPAESLVQLQLPLQTLLV